MKEIIIRKDVPFEVWQKQIGIHLIEVTTTDEGVFRTKQMQEVGKDWRSAGRKWYTEEQMQEFADAALRGEFGKVVDSGRAKIVEYDDKNLRREQFLVHGDVII